MPPATPITMIANGTTSSVRRTRSEAPATVSGTQRRTAETRKGEASSNPQANRNNQSPLINGPVANSQMLPPRNATTPAEAKGVSPTAAATASASFVSNLDISSVKGAQQALEVVDKALGAVNGARADLGAIQNRFTSVVANLQTSSENLAASRSRIRDTDFAKETAELTRTQILQQAGTAMLAQANQAPQGVLSLLQG